MGLPLFVPNVVGLGIVAVLSAKEIIIVRVCNALTVFVNGVCYHLYGIDCVYLRRRAGIYLFIGVR